MFVDASAMIAILTREEEAEALSLKLGGAVTSLTSAIAVWEAVLGLMRRKQDMRLQGAQAQVYQLIDSAQIQLVSIGPAERDAALDAFDRFGKGRHPARLNMGDCFAYACARTHGAPLLFKGEDFSLTDIDAA